MSYSDQSAPEPGRFTTAAPVTITISQPQPSAAEKVAGLSAILSTHYGADAAISCITFTTQLHEAVKTLDAANELVAREHEVAIPDAESEDPVADVSPDCYARYEEKMRAAAASFLAAADAVGELANSELLTPAILRGLPRRLLCSIIRAGLEAEADDLLDILDAVNTPPPEVSINVTADTGPLLSSLESTLDAVRELQGPVPPEDAESEGQC